MDKFKTDIQKDLTAYVIEQRRAGYKYPAIEIKWRYLSKVSYQLSLELSSPSTRGAEREIAQQRYDYVMGLQDRLGSRIAAIKRKKIENCQHTREREEGMRQKTVFCADCGKELRQYYPRSF